MVRHMATIWKSHNTESISNRLMDYVNLTTCAHMMSAPATGTPIVGLTYTFDGHLRTDTCTTHGPPNTHIGH